MPRTGPGACPGCWRRWGRSRPRAIGPGSCACWRSGPAALLRALEFKLEKRLEVLRRQPAARYPPAVHEETRRGVDAEGRTDRGVRLDLLDRPRVLRVEVRDLADV